MNDCKLCKFSEESLKQIDFDQNLIIELWIWYENNFLIKNSFEIC